MESMRNVFETIEEYDTHASISWKSFPINYNCLQWSRGKQEKLKAEILELVQTLTHNKSKENEGTELLRCNEVLHKIQNNLEKMDQLHPVLFLENKYSSILESLITKISSSLDNADQLGPEEETLNSAVHNSCEHSEIMGHLFQLHLKNTFDHLQYHHDVKEVHRLIDKRGTIFESQQQDKSSKLSNIGDNLKEHLSQFLTIHERIHNLAHRSKLLVPVHQRILSPDNLHKNLLIGRVMQPIDGAGIVTCSLYEEVQILDNSHHSLWKIKAKNGIEGYYPAICIWIPGPDKKAIDEVIAISDKLLKLWNHIIQSVLVRVTQIYQNLLPKMGIKDLFVNDLERMRKLVDDASNILLYDEANQQAMRKIIENLRNCLIVQKDQNNSFHARDNDLVQLFAPLMKLKDHILAYRKISKQSQFYQNMENYSNELSIQRQEIENQLVEIQKLKQQQEIQLLEMNSFLTDEVGSQNHSSLNNSNCLPLKIDKRHRCCREILVKDVQTQIGIVHSDSQTQYQNDIKMINKITQQESNNEIDGSVLDNLPHSSVNHLNHHQLELIDAAVQVRVSLEDRECMFQTSCNTKNGVTQTNQQDNPAEQHSLLISDTRTERANVKQDQGTSMPSLSNDCQTVPLKLRNSMCQTTSIALNSSCGCRVSMSSAAVQADTLPDLSSDISATNSLVSLQVKDSRSKKSMDVVQMSASLIDHSCQTSMTVMEAATQTTKALVNFIYSTDSIVDGKTHSVKKASVATQTTKAIIDFNYRSEYFDEIQASLYDEDCVIQIVEALVSSQTQTTEDNVILMDSESGVESSRIVFRDKSRCVDTETEHCITSENKEIQNSQHLFDCGNEFVTQMVESQSLHEGNLSSDTTQTDHGHMVDFTSQSETFTNDCAVQSEVVEHSDQDTEFRPDMMDFGCHVVSSMSDKQCSTDQWKLIDEHCSVTLEMKEISLQSCPVTSVSSETQHSILIDSRGDQTAFLMVDEFSDHGIDQQSECLQCENSMITSASHHIIQMDEKTTDSQVSLASQSVSAVPSLSVSSCQTQSILMSSSTGDENDAGDRAEFMSQEEIQRLEKMRRLRATRERHQRLQVCHSEFVLQVDSFSCQTNLNSFGWDKSIQNGSPFKSLKSRRLQTDQNLGKPKTRDRGNQSRKRKIVTVLCENSYDYTEGWTQAPDTT